MFYNIGFESLGCSILEFSCISMHFFTLLLFKNRVYRLYTCIIYNIIDESKMLTIILILKLLGYSAFVT